MPRKSDVNLTVYNLLAQKAAELFRGSLEAGRYKSEFDGTGLPSGVYFCKLTAGEYTEVRKLLLVR
ncbi:MAG: T9SS type A sorting domain-containing protein [Melioribacteraceae bacterium]